MVVAALLLPAPARAGVVALPLGPLAARVRELAPAEAPALTDPAELAKRIGENVRKANERLRAKDAGAPTRRAQEQVLRDLDALLNPPTPPNPPPSSPPPPMPMDGSPPPMPPTPPPGQGGSPPPMPPMGGGQPMPPPKGGGQPKPKSWRDQAGDDAPMPTGPMPMGAEAPGGPRPMPPGAKPEGEPKEPADGGEGEPPQAPPRSRPGVPPPEDAVAKQVWGHLPERVRRQANQYYREQFMPKYSELLKRYYAGLAEPPASGAAPRRQPEPPRSP